MTESLQEKLKRLGFPDADKMYKEAWGYEDDFTGISICNCPIKEPTQFALSINGYDTVQFLVTDQDFIAVREFIKFLRK